MIETHERILEDLDATQARLRTAESDLRLRCYKDPDSDAWEALSAEVLKEASIARAGLSRVLDLVAEDMAHDTVKLSRANEAEEQPQLPVRVNGGRQ
jgi:hypothetical protein